MPLDRRGGSELFFLDDNGRRRDAELHEEILSQGDDGPGLEVSSKIRESMLARARRYLPAEPVNKPKEPAKDAWNPFQPREPAGSPEGGQFASITGGGISGGATGGPVGEEKKKEHFKASANLGEHQARVNKIIEKPARASHGFRVRTKKLIDEAKVFASKHPESVGALDIGAAALKEKIGESFWREGTIKLEKGEAGEKTSAMLSKAYQMGFKPTAEMLGHVHQLQLGAATAVSGGSLPEPPEMKAPTKTYTQQIEEAEQALKSELEQGGSVSGFEYAHPEQADLLAQAHGSLAAAGAMWTPKKAAAPASTATIPMVTSEWTKLGPQQGSVAGGTYGDPQGNTWYIKTPKTEDHVHADLLSNALYKMAGVSVSSEIKTVLEGKVAVASKFIPGMKKLSELDASAQGYARKALREDFAMDAWLGNRDVIGQGLDNVIASPDGMAIVRLDQGGTLMYRAQGETKPFGTGVDEIHSMRSSTINPQTASVFAPMTDQEVSASIDKVLAIPESTIMKAATAHGMPSIAATLIARRAWLAEYQKTLNVPGAAEKWAAKQAAELQAKAGQPKPAWETKLEQQKVAMQPQATAAELEKAKKVGPYYPAPTSEVGKAAVKAFNEKWATKTPESHELEQKVAEYKVTKAALAHVEQQEAIAVEQAAAEQKKLAAAKAKAELAAVKAAAAAKMAAHKEKIEKIAAEIGLNPKDAEQVDSLIQLAGGDTDKIIQQFKKFQEAGVGIHGLPITPFEAAMIQSYVGSGYIRANEELRKGNWSMQTHTFARAIQTALNKLPIYTDVLKRGFNLVNSKDQEIYTEVGSVVNWPAFSSCGKSSSFSGNMQCTITPLPSNTRARDLGPMNPTEKGGEVLYMANSTFKVTKVQGKPGGSMHVWLDEVEPLT
jgi:hypothetical protein